MAYKGYFVKVGTYTVPLSIMLEDSYSARRTIVDAGSFRDADGVLHRDALSHVPNKVEFSTVPFLTSDEWEEFFRNIENNYTIPEERKAIVEVFVTEKNNYITQEMYFADPVPTVHNLDNGVPRYNSVKISITGY